jgi:hypothetical protein
MALGRKNKTPSGKLLILKIKTQDADKHAIPPHFEISEKGADGKYVKRDQTETQVQGTLVKVEVKEEDYKGDKYNKVSIILSDEDEIYLLDTRVNMLTRSLYNSLLSLTSFDDVSISLYVYKKTDKATGAVTEYPAVSVWQNGQQVKWLVPIADQPKPVSVIFKGKKQNDYTEVDNLFVEKLKTFSKVVESASKGSKSKKPTPDIPSTDTQDELDEEPLDGAPF